MDQIVDDVISSLAHKTPSVRSESALFLARTFKRCSPVTLNKKMLKAFTVPLCTASTDTVPEVREASFAALGTAMYIAGTKNIQPFLGDLDSIRMSKIEEQFNKIKSAEDTCNLG